MSERLDKVKLVKGRNWERKDPLDNIGVSTYALIKDAIEEGRNDLAKDLVDYLYFREIKTVRDVNIDLAGGFPQFYMANYGEYGLYDIFRGIMIRSLAADGDTSWPRQPVRKRDTSSIDWAMDFSARMVRLHRMGKNDGVDGFTIEEYDDRIEIIWDPCYTGGRTRRGDPITGSPPHTGMPYNYAVTRAPHTWSWGKSGVTGYCIHCCIVHELLEIEQTGGYLQQWICGHSDNPWDPCRNIIYKDVDWIPEKYYTRIGKVKPEMTTKAPGPENPKLVKVTHSNELGTRWIHVVPRLKKAIDAGNRKEAIKLVDTLNAETKLWHLSFPIRWNWTWMDLIVERYGYNDLFYALKSLHSPMEPPPAPDTPRPAKASIPDAEERARRGALWGRGDQSGQGETSVRIIDEPDRIVMELDPCGSCGRCLIGMESMDDTTAAIYEELKLELYFTFPIMPLTKSPFNLEVTGEAHPVGWNKVGIPHFCTRCCVHFEMAAIARTGYLTTVIERPENATDPTCRWFFYKDLDNIPEEYYERIGAKKPPRQE